MIRIREYNEDDRKKVEEMITKVLFELFGEHLIRKLEDFKEYSIFYVVEDDKRIVGTAALKDMGGGNGKLKRMYLLADYRKKGLGQRLFDKILSFAKEHKFNRIVLSTEQRLKASHKFYEKNGFVDIKNVNWEKDFADLKNEKVNIKEVRFMEKKL